MSDIQTFREGNLLIAAVAGPIDMRVAGDLEQELIKAVEEGARRIVVDFSRVDLLAGAGIRVLVTLAGRLEACGGAIVLCSLRPTLQRVFDVSGLVTQFRIVTSQTDAVAALQDVAPAPLLPRESRLSRVVASLLGIDSPRNVPSRHRRAAGSLLSAQVMRLLSGRPTDRDR